MDREISLPKDFAGRVFINGAQVWPAGYCCEVGERLGLRGCCNKCADISAGFQSCIGVSQDSIRDALELLLEMSDIAPEANCACHISGPCSDCIEWAALREARKYANEILATPQPAQAVSVPDMQTMVNRFLAWKLPKTVCADPIATHYGHPCRSGTNLLSAEEARAMLEHVLAAPEAPQS